MHPVDLLAPASPISWDNIPLRRIQTPTRAGRDGKRLNSTVYGYTFLLATLYPLARPSEALLRLNVQFLTNGEVTLLCCISTPIWSLPFLRGLNCFEGKPHLKTRKPYLRGHPEAA